MLRKGEIGRVLSLLVEAQREREEGKIQIERDAERETLRERKRHSERETL